MSWCASRRCRSSWGWHRISGAARLASRCCRLARDVSAAFAQAFFRSETGEAPIVLLTVFHKLLPEPIYLCLNSEPITSRGNEHLPHPFAPQFLEQHPDRAPQVTITVDNVERGIVQAIRLADTPPEIVLEVVLADTPDTVEMGTPRMQWRQSSWTVTSLTGTIEGPSVHHRRFPAHQFSPRWVPGIFRQ